MLLPASPVRWSCLHWSSQIYAWVPLCWWWAHPIFQHHRAPRCSHHWPTEIDLDPADTINVISYFASYCHLGKIMESEISARPHCSLMYQCIHYPSAWTNIRKFHTWNERLRWGTPAISSYSAASNSHKWLGWKNLGRTCCLMLIRMKKGKGNKIPAIGIHVMPKHTRRYTNWKIVKIAIFSKGTDSTKDAWTPSSTLPK